MARPARLAATQNCQRSVEKAATAIIAIQTQSVPASASLCPMRSCTYPKAKAPAAAVLAPVELPLVPSKDDLRRANTQLTAQVEALRAENAQLRTTVRGSSWLNAASDFSRTLGLTFGWAGVYFTLSLAWLGGRTPGKWLVGTRVVRLDGRPLTTLDAFTRYGGYTAGLATGLIGFARVLWEPNRQAIEDKIAWTVVLRGR